MSGARSPLSLAVAGLRMRWRKGRSSTAAARIAHA